jgi:hypothetical protein
MQIKSSRSTQPFSGYIVVVPQRWPLNPAKKPRRNYRNMLLHKVPEVSPASYAEANSFMAAWNSLNPVAETSKTRRHLPCYVKLVTNHSRKAKPSRRG